MTEFYDICYDSIKMQVRAIPETIDNVDNRNVEILKDKRIILIGCGDSYAVADYGKWAFLPLMLNINCLSPPELVRISLDEDTLVVGITASGRSLETITALQYAKKSGAATVVLTDNKKGKASEYADHVWETKSGVKTYNTSPSAPTTSAMAYLLKLADFYQNEMDTKIHCDLLRFKSVGAEMLSWAETVAKELSQLPKPGEMVYLISEGPNYIAAQIGMMKFNEYSIIKATAALREEFRHFYNLSVRDGDPAILITDSPRDERDAMYMSVITNTLKMRGFHLHCSESLDLQSSLGQVIANTVVLQMTAYYSALRHNPNKRMFRLPHAEAFKIY